MIIRVDNLFSSFGKKIAHLASKPCLVPSNATFSLDHSCDKEINSSVSKI